jgi:hypothetical protein
MVKKQKKGKFILATFLMLLLVLNFSFLFAKKSFAADASLYFSPSSGSYKVGQSFNVGVYVSSPGQAANAMSGNIAFDQGVLSISSISKSGSIMSLWSREPSFSNSSGSASFEGIVLNPGYQGSSGKIITISFKVKASGPASVRFASGSVLANDGLGTNIISGLGSANFNTNSIPTETPADQTPPAETSATGLPGLPKVSSDTHPDSEKWYADPNPTFKWALPSGVTAVNIFGDQIATTDPGTTSDGLKSAYVYKNVADGVWYFHLKFKNAKGWGPTAHFKFQVDTSKPESLDAKVDTSDPNKSVLKIQSTDKVSGTDHYSIRIDDKESMDWKDDGTGAYALSGLDVGSHKAVVIAFDKAGNSIEKMVEFELNAPAKEITKKQPLNIPLKKGIEYSGYAALIAAGLFVFTRYGGALLALPLGMISSVATVGRRRGAKAMLLENIEMLERAERKRDLTHEEEKILVSSRRALYGGSIGRMGTYKKNERVVEGIFDGENMQGNDGKTYAVQPNYASKSKMVEGDELRLTIKGDDEEFMYKQTGPTERKKLSGILGEQDNGEYRVVADGKAYKVLPASLTFFNIQPGDQVKISLPKSQHATWAAIERLEKRGAGLESQENAQEEKAPPAKRYHQSKKGKKSTK